MTLTAGCTWSVYALGMRTATEEKKVRTFAAAVAAPVDGGSECSKYRFV
jgi:hypothetical protein